MVPVENNFKEMGIMGYYEINIWTFLLKSSYIYEQPRCIKIITNQIKHKCYVLL